MKGSVVKICRAGLVWSFILFSFLTMTTSMSLDLTELRNKVSKIKVNPRGNLWATGHFMGKKSVPDSSSMGSSFEEDDGSDDDRTPRSLDHTEVLQTVLLKLLHSPRPGPQKRSAHTGGDPARAAFSHTADVS